jgi:hypothetical protein
MEGPRSRGTGTGAPRSPRGDLPGWGNPRRHRPRIPLRGRGRSPVRPVRTGKEPRRSAGSPRGPAAGQKAEPSGGASALRAEANSVRLLHEDELQRRPHRRDRQGSSGSRTGRTSAPRGDGPRSRSGGRSARRRVGIGGTGGTGIVQGSAGAARFSGGGRGDRRARAEVGPPVPGPAGGPLRRRKGEGPVGRLRRQGFRSFGEGAPPEASSPPRPREGPHRGPLPGPGLGPSGGRASPAPEGSAPRDGTEGTAGERAGSAASRAGAASPGGGIEDAGLVATGAAAGGGTGAGGRGASRPPQPMQKLWSGATGAPQRGQAGRTGAGAGAAAGGVSPRGAPQAMQNRSSPGR